MSINSGHKALRNLERRIEQLARQHPRCMLELSLIITDGIMHVGVVKVTELERLGDASDLTAPSASTTIASSGNI